MHEFHHCPKGSLKPLCFELELLTNLCTPFQVPQVYGEQELCLTGLLLSADLSLACHTLVEPVRGGKVLEGACLLSGMAESQAPTLMRL